MCCKCCGQGNLAFVGTDLPLLRDIQTRPDFSPLLFCGETERGIIRRNGVTVYALLKNYAPLHRNYSRRRPSNEAAVVDFLLLLTDGDIYKILGVATSGIFLPGDDHRTN